jgi:hypothetical protein
MVSQDLTQIVASVFFDGETHGHGKPKKKPIISGPDQVIYAGLRGGHPGDHRAFRTTHVAELYLQARWQPVEGSSSS